VFLEEGQEVTRLARAVAETSGSQAWTDLASALGAVPRARRSSERLVVELSERELSVLRFLPTRLSNAEIASECIISVNTVKTHLKGIYTKLGVTSRSEAVERARLLGLI